MLDRLFNQTPTIYKFDQGLIGFIPALFLPLAGIPFFYWVKFSDRTFAMYLLMVKQPTVLSPMLSFGLVLNLFLFFGFISNNYYNAARGVIFSTILYAIPIVVTKFFL